MLARDLQRWSSAGADSVILMRAATQDHRSPVRAPRATGARRPEGIGGPRSYVAIFALTEDDLEELARRITAVAQRDAEGLPPGLYPYAIRFRCAGSDVARLPLTVLVADEPAPETQRE